MQQDNIKSRQRPNVGFQKIPLIYALLWEPANGPHLLTLLAPKVHLRTRHSFQRHPMLQSLERSAKG